MDPRTVNFLIFAVVSVVALALGHEARRRGWLDESWSRRIHFHTVAWVWTITSVLALWRLELHPGQIWLIALNPAVLVAGSAAAILLARAMKLSRSATGVMAIAGGVTNSGVTLGAYVCYRLLEPPEQAIAYALAWVSVMQVCGIVMLYPIARHYGSDPASTRSLRELMFATFIDWRSLPLLGALVGVLLSWAGASDGGLVDRFHLLHLLFFLGGGASYFGIGMRLRLGRSLRRYPREHAILAAVHFIAMPLLVAGLVWLINRSPLPLDGLGTDVVLITAFMPTAIMTVMIANLFDLDAHLAGAVWLWNTIFFLAAPLPILLLAYT